jgi:hypothetical protein
MAFEFSPFPGFLASCSTCPSLLWLQAFELIHFR